MGFMTIMVCLFTFALINLTEIETAKIRKSSRTNETLTCPKGCPKECYATGRCKQCLKPGVRLPFCKKPCGVGRYGMHCVEKCSNLCTDSRCDPETGHCLQCQEAGYLLPSCKQPCSSGAYGNNCTHLCPLVCKKTCDRKTGHCFRCQHGEGPHCTVNCADPSESVTCEKYCPKKCLALCNTSNGKCNLCTPGHKLPYCNQSCDEGFYGNDCRSKCSERCKNQQCDHITGLCNMGCLPGYVGKLCNGRCIPGLFGEECSLKCPETCAEQLCDFRTGHCIDCISGYMGRECQEMCPLSKHGPNCTLNCPENCDRQCEPTTGVCWHCLPGWKGLTCNETCSEGHYGGRCFNQCSSGCLDQKCHHISGECLQCKENFEGQFCAALKTTEDNDFLQLVLWNLLGVFAPAIIISAGLVVYKYQLNKTAKGFLRRKNDILVSRSKMKQSVGANKLESGLGSSSSCNLSRDSGPMFLCREQNKDSEKTNDTKFDSSQIDESEELVSLNFPQIDNSREFGTLKLNSSKLKHKILPTRPKNNLGGREANISSDSSSLAEAGRHTVATYGVSQRSSQCYSESEPASLASTYNVQDTQCAEVVNHTENGPPRKGDSYVEMHMACGVAEQSVTLVKATTKAKTTMSFSKQLHLSENALNNLQCTKKVKATVSANANLQGNATDNSFSKVKMNLTYSGNEASVDSLYGIKSNELSMNTLSLTLPEEGAVEQVATASFVSREEQTSIQHEQNTSDHAIHSSEEDTNVTVLKQIKHVSDTTDLPGQEIIINGSTTTTHKETKICHIPDLCPNEDDESIAGVSESTITIPYNHFDQASDAEPSTYSYEAICEKTHNEPSVCESKGCDPPSLSYNDSKSNPNGHRSIGALEKCITCLKRYEAADEHSNDHHGLQYVCELSTFMESEVREKTYHKMTGPSTDAPLRGILKSRDSRPTALPRRKLDTASAEDQNLVAASTSTGDLYLSDQEQNQECEHAINTADNPPVELLTKKKFGKNGKNHQASKTFKTVTKSPTPSRRFMSAPVPLKPQGEGHSVFRCPITRQASPKSPTSFVGRSAPVPKSLPAPPPEGLQHLIDRRRRISGESTASHESSDSSNN